MPFPDGTFDALWTIWVLEHIPNPEQALIEMRRVIKPGGYLFLYPALDVSRLSSRGIHARSYEDLDWSGKVLKAMVPVAESKAFLFSTTTRCGRCDRWGPGWDQGHRDFTSSVWIRITSSIGRATAMRRRRSPTTSCICGSPAAAICA
jgi:SAM-dependent methyltransferase